MKKNQAVPLWLVAIASIAVLSYPQVQQRGSGDNRGRYLVEEVARCWECHTPMSGQGQWDQGRWLQGASVWFRPVKPITDWGYLAPRIAGLRSFSDEQARMVLEKGIGPNGLPIRLPMHAYHMAPEDAQSVIAYLRSVGTR